MTQRVRIYLPPKTAMQSGKAGTHQWLMDYLSDTPRAPDPLMGWIGGGDTVAQLRLRFDTREEAIAFAERNALAYEVELPRAQRFRPKAYADNFKVNRRENWTH